MSIADILRASRPACACGSPATTTFNGLAVCVKCHEAATHYHPEVKP